MMEPDSTTFNSQLSPLNPPDAFHPPSSDNIAIDDLHPYLRQLAGEHEAIRLALKKFEETIMAIKEKGVTKEVNNALKDFFQFFNEELMAHMKREEKDLFPILTQALNNKRKGSSFEGVTTAVDVMEEDHLKAVQLTVVIFNFFGLVARLNDQVSRDLVMDAALAEADQLIELLRLHIFREETIIFPFIHKSVDIKELNCLQDN
ncbi:MAG: hemerythrin domain-containing protein [Candidatus Omnitrophica bacterium]|nr:hemerythrin domain-containing protein [Candidatus Omnitrophota bacterium]